MATILVVDDHPDNRAYLTHLLAHRGHRLLEASDGAEALGRAISEHPDLVIADILMPTMDGCELVHKMRADATIADTPVILYTAAYHEREVKSLAGRCGVLHVLTKPASPQRILDCVGEALGYPQVGASAAEPHEFDEHTADPLTALNGRLDKLETSGDAAEHPSTSAEQFKQEHTRVLTDKLSQKADELDVANLRLRALVELIQQLTAERITSTMLDRAIRAARALVGARHASVCILEVDDQVFRHVCSSGATMSAASAQRPTPANELLAQVLGTVKLHRAEITPTQVLALGFPPDARAATSFLGVPIASGTHVYGVMFLLGKLSPDPFSDEDARLATAIATQVAVTYENMLQQEDLVRQAEALKQSLADVQRAESQLRSANEDLETRVAARTADLARSNAELEQFAYVAAHDLQEPLRKVVGYTQLLADRYNNQIDETANEFIAFAVDGAKRMQNLVQDLLAYSRVGRKQVQRKLVNVEATLGSVLAALKEQIDQEAAQVTHDRLPAVLADEGQLFQLLQNLVANAIKFHGAEPPRVHIGVDYADDEWIFSVKDNGIGIEPKYFDRIFVIFQRLHTRQEYPGTGIGLAICKKIVERHGGRIWLESQPGQGTTFRFTLPDPPASSARTQP